MREYFYELLERAHQNGIRTFGDIIRKSGIDAYDIWGDEYDDTLKHEFIYYCNASVDALEMLAECGDI
jgi:hypothetical protein